MKNPEAPLLFKAGEDEWLDWIQENYFLPDFIVQSLLKASDPKQKLLDTDVSAIGEGLMQFPQ